MLPKSIARKTAPAIEIPIKKFIAPPVDRTEEDTVLVQLRLPRQLFEAIQAAAWYDCNGDINEWATIWLKSSAECDCIELAHKLQDLVKFDN